MGKEDEGQKRKKDWKDCLSKSQTGTAWFTINGALWCLVIVVN